MHINNIPLQIADNSFSFLYFLFAGLNLLVFWNFFGVFILFWVCFCFHNVHISSPQISFYHLNTEIELLLFFSRGSENAENSATLCILTDFLFFFPLQQLTILVLYWRLVHKYTTVQTEATQVHWVLLLYIPPHMLVHTHLDSLLTKNFLLKINDIFH